MTRSGWTGPRRRRWRLWRGGCWPSRSRWCSPRGSRARSAQATLGPDEDVASELERSAGRAQARGGLAAAAAFLERSAALTLDPARRAGRALAAAQATYQAGAFDAALALLATAEAGPPDEFRRARADLLRGQVAFASSRGSDAPPLLLKAARQFGPLDARLARETYLDALAAAIFVGHLALGGGVQEVAEAALAAPPPPRPARGPDLLLDGLALLICEGYPAGAPVLRRAVSAFRGTDVSAEEELRWLWLASYAAVIVLDYASWDVLSDRQVTLARDAGALIALPIALSTRSGVHLFAGEFTEAAAHLTENFTIEALTGLEPALTELREFALARIGETMPLPYILDLGYLPAVLRDHPTAVVPYLVGRDCFIARLYHQRTGYWQPDGQGLDARSPEEKAAALDLLAGEKASAFAYAGATLADQGDLALALEILTPGLLRHPDSRELAELRHMAKLDALGGDARACPAVRCSRPG